MPTARRSLSTGRRSCAIGLLGALLLVGGAHGVLASDAASDPSPSLEACPSAAPTPLSSAPPSALPTVTEPCASPSASTEPGTSVAPETPAEVVVEAGDLWFDPPVVVIPSTGPTELTLIDRGFITHNLTVDELGLVLVAPAGRSATATLTDLEPGEYRFYCSISGHAQAGMEGTLVVE